MGTGKTLTLTAIGWHDFQRGRKVYANFFTTFSERVEVQDIAKRFMTEDFDNSTVLLDEAYLWADARQSMARSNQLINAFIHQTRKMGVDLYAAIHYFGYIDLRIRRATSLRIHPVYNKRTKTCRLRIHNLDTGERTKIVLDGPAYFGLYNTYERMAPSRRTRSVQF